MPTIPPLNALRAFEAAARHHGHGVQRVLWVTLLLNLAVALAKLVAGLLTHSLTLLGDAAHSAIDIDRRTGQLDHLAVSLVVLAQIEQCHGDPARALAVEIADNTSAVAVAAAVQ